MNMIMCSECCRWQKDGLCTLDDLTHAGSPSGSGCRYFESPDQGAHS